MEAVALYQITMDGRLSIPLVLNSKQAKLVSIIPWSRNKPRYATSTTSQAIMYDSQSRLLVRATTAGSYSSILDLSDCYKQRPAGDEFEDLDIEHRRLAAG